MPLEHFPLHRRRLLHGGLALAAAGWLAPARACEFYAPNFTLIHPWTRASRPDATSAVVGMSFQDVTADDRLIGVRTPVAEGAEMGGAGTLPALDFPIPAGRTTVLAEAGPHLRLTGLKLPLEMAREYPMTLIFAKAGAVRARLTVDYERFR